MQSVLRVLRIIVIVVVILGAGGVATYFALPPRASASKTFTVARPSQTVFTFLASTPANTQIAKGVTQPEVDSAANNVVTATVTYADGAKGTATYTVAPQGENTQVTLKMDHPLGAKPMERIQAITGGNVKALVDAAATTITTQLGSIKTTDFAGLKYSVVQLLSEPFFYIENCTSKESRDITSVINQAVQAIPQLMKANHLKQDGPLIAVEPKVVQGQYCYQVGYRYVGAKPNALLVGKFGDSPAGTALQVTYTGTEDQVVPEVYDRMDTLLAATRLDDPTRTDDDWPTFEAYNDDPSQPGGSRNRTIYYVVPPGVDISRLTTLVPPEGAAGAPAPATDAAAPAAAASSASATAAATSASSASSASSGTSSPPASPAASSAAASSAPAASAASSSSATP